MRKQTAQTPNPAGQHGKPFTLAPHSFDDALRKILAAPPESKTEHKKAQPKPRKKTTIKKR
jgi:hypothetical protein